MVKEAIQKTTPTESVPAFKIINSNSLDINQTPSRLPLPQPDLNPNIADAEKKAKEKELVFNAINKDQSAFASLYDIHMSRIYKHIYYLVNDQHQAEDLTAQTFLKAWEAIDRYKERGAPFVAWLLRISHNLTISYLRSKRNNTNIEDYKDFIMDRKTRNNPYDYTENMEDHAEIQNAVLQLKGQYLQVVMLRFVEEKSYEEVAEIMGKSIPAIRVIQFRALGKMKNILQKQNA